MTTGTQQQYDAAILNQLVVNAEKTSAVRERLVFVERAAEQLTAEVNGLREDTRANTQRLGIVEQKVEQLSQDVATLKEDVATLKEDVATLKEDVATLKENMVTKESFEELKARIDKFEGRFNRLEKYMISFLLLLGMVATGILINVLSQPVLKTLSL